MPPAVMAWNWNFKTGRYQMPGSQYHKVKTGIFFVNII